MEWKPYYDQELRQPGVRSRLEDWLEAAASMPPLGEPCASTILSFPHTAVDYSGPLLARVADMLYRSNARRVIALGVLHTALTPAIQQAMDTASPPSQRERAFERVAGATYPDCRQQTTPWGMYPFALPPSPVPGVLRGASDGDLHREFSLDTFLAVMRLAADVRRTVPLPVLPLYVGMTRHPVSGSFRTAADLATWLTGQWDESTAVVATGDVVHYGAYYGSPPDDDSPDPHAIWRRRVQGVIHRALWDRDLEGAYQASLAQLKSDQREILPAIACLLGQNAAAEIISFQLSDYASVLDVPPPCLVASALIAYGACGDAAADRGSGNESRSHEPH